MIKNVESIYSGLKTHVTILDDFVGTFLEPMRILVFIGSNRRNSNRRYKLTTQLMNLLKKESEQAYSTQAVKYV